MSEPLLSVSELRTQFATRSGLVVAVDGISFDLPVGGTLGLVGESGSGKSLTALSIMRLVPPPGRIVAGQVRFEGQDLLKAGEGQLRHVRGGRIGFVFQDPMTSLNPLMTVGDQIVESLQLHTPLRGGAARRRAVELLDLVGIPFAQQRVGNYPHEFSGGMRQRAMIAIAIACKPALLIADEPTTALDVTIQAQILDLLKDLRAEMGMALILISHDLGVVSYMCEQIAVMYAGRIVESSPAADLFTHPSHPYTRGLLMCRPHLRRGSARLMPIPGAPPSLLAGAWSECAFAPRCSFVEDGCREAAPELIDIDSAGHQARCWVTQRTGTLAPPDGEEVTVG